MFHQSEDQKIISAQKDIRSQTVKKEISLFETTKKRGPITLKNSAMLYVPSSPHQVKRERTFVAMGLLVTN